jgi:transposase
VNKAKRIVFARAGVDRSNTEWDRFLWTDEVSVRCGCGQVFVTRKTGEKFDLDCLVPKFRKYSAGMFWGAISTSVRGPIVPFGQGVKITAEVYKNLIIPHIYYWTTVTESRYLPAGTRMLIMEDNASVHKAKLVRDEHVRRGGEVIDWPANSPDLNPIENVWRVLKARVAKRWPKIAKEVEEVVVDEWSKLTHEDISRYCNGDVMRARCHAVLQARGGPIDG